MAQHGYQSQPETHRERANRLKRERRASLDHVEKEAMAQLRRESRRQKDPEEQPPVPQQNSNQETAQKRANRLKRERRASLDHVEKKAMAQLRRESRRQKDPEEQPPVPQQNSNQETAQKERIALNENVEQVLILWRKKLRHNSGQLYHRIRATYHRFQATYHRIRATYHRKDAGDLSQEEDDMDTMMASLADPENEKYYTIYTYIYTTFKLLFCNHFHFGISINNTVADP